MSRSKRRRGRPNKVEPAPLPPPMKREEEDTAPQQDSLIDRSLEDANKTARADIKMIGSAVNNRWGVSDRLKRKAVRKMGKLLDEDNKSALGAARVLTAMDRNDIQRETLDKRPDERTKIDVNINVEVTQQQTELAALAAALQAQRTVEGLLDQSATFDNRANAGQMRVSTQGSDGN